jgi:dienelactone hydrolase
MNRTPFPTVIFLLPVLASHLLAEPLPNTKPLVTNGDIAEKMVAGIDKYLMRAIDRSVEKRKQYWNLNLSSDAEYEKSVQPNRERLAHVLGVVDKRVPIKALELAGTTETKSLVGEGDGYKVFAVRWPVLEGIDAEGLFLEPREKPKACVIAIPDADWTPEMLVGLVPGIPDEAQFARRLAENGCQVLVPTLIDRNDTWSGNPKYRMTNQPHREYIYRMAFEMGRHIIGYEVQKVLGAVDWFTRSEGHPPVGVYGYGEGGLVGFYATALDPRIKAVLVSGYFGPREKMWSEPIYRNVWRGLLEFADADAGLLIMPRALIIEPSSFPKVTGPPSPHNNRQGAAPGVMPMNSTDAVISEKNRLANYFGSQAASVLRWAAHIPPIASATSTDRLGVGVGMQDFWKTLGGWKDGLREAGKVPKTRVEEFIPELRQKRQFDQLVAYTQKLMRDSEHRRQETFWSKLDTTSLERFQSSTQKYRDQFWEEVIGKLPEPTEPMNPCSRLSYEETKWTGYEVTLDLYPDVFAYGILLIPKDLKPGEKRPVVVCQHGLEGRPQDVVNPKMKTRHYNSFGAQLADRGYIVYAPQNPYIGHDKFRVLQRKANPLGLSLFSFIVRQHERSLDWLAGLPFVDSERIAFYGLSYGGKTAMRVPAILPRYCLSICSGDFNEWIWKNVSVDFSSSYMFSGEYEMYEFNLGHTFGYAEMAALIAPRPFMVERGHNDPVGIDEWVAYEYAKVRRWYAKLGISDRTTIEFFNGGHEIHSKATFEFLDRHLRFAKN